MKILLVDDHAMVRAGLSRLLEGHEFAEAADAQQALAAVRAERPELVVLDLNLPDGGGVELIRRLLREAPSLRVLVLSMHAEPLYAVRALEAGARGYVSKAAPPGELLAAVRALSTGGRYIEAEIAQEIALRQASSGPLDRLSARELEILRMLAAGRSLHEIAAALGVAYKTIANACTPLKARLGATSMADLVRMALELEGRTTATRGAA